MVVHEDPGVDRAFSFCDVFPQPFQKAGLVLVICEDIGFVDPAHHDVMQGAGGVEAGFARHGLSIVYESSGVKRFALNASTSPMVYAKRDQKALLHYLDALVQKNTATG